MDRRDFIKQSALATAGFSILPSGSLFADTTKVRLGYIGVGLRGRNHIGEGLLRDDVEIVSHLRYTGKLPAILPRAV